jgi:hypothetical protein
LKAGKAAVKNLKTREQVLVDRNGIVEQIEKFLPSDS